MVSSTFLCAPKLLNDAHTHSTRTIMWAGDVKRAAPSNSGMSVFWCGGKFLPGEHVRVLGQVSFLPGNAAPPLLSTHRITIIIIIIIITVLVQAWYPTTVATNSRIYKQVIHHYLALTHDNLLLLDYSMHDCGYRGVSSVETAAIGGAANMINFKASDTVAGSCLLRKYYHVETVGGISGSGSEHSTITTWGRHREADAFKHMLNIYKGRAIGCVIDSYDMWKCCEEILGGQLKELVKDHAKSGGYIVVCPDSGDPNVVVLKCLEILGQQFGTETNSKGYKMLPAFLRVFQGDGVSYKSIGTILETLKNNGWSAANVGFGSGASLLQRLDRDTQKFAYKCSQAVVGGEEVEVYKEPITDTGKTSKKGRLTLQRDNGTFTTIQHGKGDPEKDLLVAVFENGELLLDYTFDEIRQRAQLTPDDISILKFLADEK